jgi:aerobic carbon-monoxide dehydrogenase small subunit
MEKQLLHITVNNEAYELFINPKALLVEVIRDYLGFTGTKRACESVSCGCCTVMVEGMSVKSCSVLAMSVEGMTVNTVEGLEENGKLSPVQRAFLDQGAFQCGFCTTGMLMSATAFVGEVAREKRTPSLHEVKESIEGNLCRCTGYNSIVRAIDSVVKGQYKED